MAGKPATYKKFPGRWFSPFARRSLWEGPDHLLWVESSLMQEHYKRFYFKDIQALVVRRNALQHVWTLFWGVLLLLTGGLALRTAGSAFVLETITILWALCLLINLIKGPCCECDLQTAVQLERLTTLVRERRAYKVADRIKMLAEAAQGRFQRRSAGGGAPAGPAYMAGVAPPTASRGTLPHTPYKPLLHQLLFTVVLCQGLFGGMVFWLQQSWIVGFGMASLMATLVLAIMVLVREHRTVKSALLATATWLTLVLVALNGLYAYGLFIYASVRDPESAFDYWSILQSFLELHVNAGPMQSVLLAGFAASAVALGAVGLTAATLQHRR
ncbi:MAG: hypothetical protein KFF50_10320 [Desulfatitalea sp.]|nr:hypothetical protein [Desulfatitalea sp.]